MLPVSGKHFAKAHGCQCFMEIKSQFHQATGIVVACVAGGHILLATAGVAGFGLNAAQYMMERAKSSSSGCLFGARLWTAFVSPSCITINYSRLLQA